MRYYTKRIVPEMLIKTSHIFLTAVIALGFLIFAPPSFAATYFIRNVTELQAMKDNLTGNYILANNIDASETQNWNGGAGFIPVGRRGDPLGVLLTEKVTPYEICILTQMVSIILVYLDTSGERQ